MDLGLSNSAWRAHGHSIARVVPYGIFADIQQASWWMDRVDNLEAADREDVELAFKSVKAAMVAVGPLAGLDEEEVHRRLADADRVGEDDSAPQPEG